MKKPPTTHNRMDGAASPGSPTGPALPGFKWGRAFRTFWGWGMMAALVLALPAYAPASDYGRMLESTRALGMGGALTAAPVGSDSFFYNPAGLSLVDDWQVEITGMHDGSQNNPEGFFKEAQGQRGRLLTDATLFLNSRGQGHYLLRDQGMASYHSANGFGLGVFENTTRMARPVQLPNPVPPPVTNPGIEFRDQKFTGGFMAWSFASQNRTFIWGVNAKHLNIEYSGSIAGAPELITPPPPYKPVVDNQWFYDTGVLIRLPIPFLRPTLGVALINGNNSSKKFDPASGLMEEVNIGVALGPMMLGETIQLVLSADVRDVTKNNPEFARHEPLRRHLGGELSFFPIGKNLYGLQLRGGTSQGYPTAGAAINFTKNLSLEAAQYTEELGSPDSLDPAQQRIPQKRTTAQVRLKF